MKETPLLKRVRVALSRLGCVMFRNNVGAAWQGDAVELGGNKVLITNARRVKYGLFVGSSDLIGWRSVTVTQDMVGKSVAVFVALETKGKHGRLTQEQRGFIGAVANAGGFAGHARTVEEAETIAREGKCQNASTSQQSPPPLSRT